MPSTSRLQSVSVVVFVVTVAVNFLAFSLHHPIFYFFSSFHLNFFFPFIFFLLSFSFSSIRLLAVGTTGTALPEVDDDLELPDVPAVPLPAKAKATKVVCPAIPTTKT